MNEAEVVNIKTGDRVKWLSKTGKSWRYGNVIHIFDFRNIWPTATKTEPLSMLK